MSGYSALSLQDYIRSRHPASLPPSLSHTAYTQQYIKCGMIFVKLREREGQRVDLGRSLKGHL